MEAISVGGGGEMAGFESDLAFGVVMVDFDGLAAVTIGGGGLLGVTVVTAGIRTITTPPRIVEYWGNNRSCKCQICNINKPIRTNGTVRIAYRRVS